MGQFIHTTQNQSHRRSGRRTIATNHRNLNGRFRNLERQDLPKFLRTITTENPYYQGAPDPNLNAKVFRNKGTHRDLCRKADRFHDNLEA